MNMFLAYGLLAGLLLHVAENCNKLGVLLYKDLACTPKNYSAESGCPSGFDCEEAMKSKKGHCRFRGTKCEIGKQIDYNMIQGSCDTPCVCVDRKESPRFDCGRYVCDEWQSTDLPTSLTTPECYWYYKLGHCCAKLETCPPFDESIVCKVDGRTYMEGQRFTPKGTCLDCVCEEGFNGTFTKPFCQKKDCYVELLNAIKIEKKCAPMYYSDDKTFCCPDSWVCPSSAKLKLKPNPEGSATKSCKFGKKTIRGNKQFAISVEQFGKIRKLECKCLMPPLVSCVGKW